MPDLPLGKLGTNAAHLVEAGGVEPPSEKVLNQKPTCVFSSLAFAADSDELTRAADN